MTDINPGGPLSVDLLDDDEAQDQAVLACLRTRKGERYNRPEYGTSFRKYLHRPATIETEALIRQEGILSLQTNEPDIPINTSTSEVELQADGQTYLIDLRYGLRSLRFLLGDQR